MAGVMSSIRDRNAKMNRVAKEMAGTRGKPAAAVVVAKPSRAGRMERDFMKDVYAKGKGLRTAAPPPPPKAIKKPKKKKMTLEEVRAKIKALEGK